MTPILSIDDSWYHKPPRIKERVSAGGVVARLEEGRVLVALIREGGLPLWVLPKGGVEKGEDLETTARREIGEEAGLFDLHLIQKLGVRERLNGPKTRWQITHHFLFWTRQIIGVPTDPKHEYQVEWFALDALPDFLWPEQRTLLEASRNMIEQALKDCERPGA